MATNKNTDMENRQNAMDDQQTAQAAQSETMGDTEPVKPAAPEKVDIYIERANGNDEPNLQVCVNGVMYLLPKGKNSTVPKAVYDEIMRSRRARDRMDERMDELREAAKQPE